MINFKIKETENLALIKKFKQELIKAYDKDSEAKEYCLKKVYSILHLFNEAGISPYINWSGYGRQVSNANVIANLFGDSHIFDHEYTLNLITKLEGWYETRRDARIRELKNPFYYLSLVAKLPLRILTEAGVSASSITSFESSKKGIFYKAVVMLITLGTFIAWILGVLNNIAGLITFGVSP